MSTNTYSKEELYDFFSRVENGLQIDDIEYVCELKYDGVAISLLYEEGKFVRRERYVGSCSRSFYVGNEVKSEDIKASFKNGILKIEVPKKEYKKELPEKKYIQIED